MAPDARPIVTGLLSRLEQPTRRHLLHVPTTAAGVLQILLKRDAIMHKNSVLSILSRHYFQMNTSARHGVRNSTSERYDRDRPERPAGIAEEIAVD